MKRRGFTLLEILVVIGLIALLSSLLVMAIGHMQTSAKRQQTTLVLENLRNMYVEYDSQQHPSLGMSHFNTSPSSMMLQYAGIASPANVTTNGTDRNGDVVQETRAVMSTLTAYTVNAAAIGKMSAASIMTFAGPYPSPPLWDYTATYHVYDEVMVPILPTPPAPALGYNIYMRIQIYTDSSGNVLQDGQPNNATAASSLYTVNSPGNTSYWQLMPVVSNTAIPLSIPVILDGWGNPVIFVMSGVFGRQSAPGALTAGGQIAQVQSPDGRPFFASAGPDGDFSKGDDNLYSFEK